MKNTMRAAQQKTDSGMTGHVRHGRTFRRGGWQACRQNRRSTRTLLVGCGDVGLRLLAAVNARKLRIVATCRRPEQAEAIRQRGGIPLIGDLSDRRFVRRLAALSGTGLIWLAPPPPQGARDPYSRYMVAALGQRKPAASRPELRVVYVSTTGVYGDRAGQWTFETTPLRPANARAIRRVDAENVWRERLPGKRPEAGRYQSVSILRAPGIYAADRLPVDRLRAGTPAIVAPEDSWSNHIHADDLARLSWRARFRSGGRRVFNAVDNEPMRMGDYFDRVADHFKLPRPPRLAREAIRVTVSPMLWSFMGESRRLSNDRLEELGVKLRYPTVSDFLRGM